MASLTDKECELVAIGASIGAGCRPCTRYHVGAALKNGLTAEEVRRAIDEAQAARCEAVALVGEVGRSSLGIDGGGNGNHLQPAGREQLLVCVGAAAGGNAANLVKLYTSGPVGADLSGEELQLALEIAEGVKEHAGEFFRRDADRLTPQATPAVERIGASCGCQTPATAAEEEEGAKASCGRQTPATASAAAEQGAGTSCGCQTPGGQS